MVVDINKSVFIYKQIHFKACNNIVHYEKTGKIMVLEIRQIFLSAHGQNK